MIDITGNMITGIRIYMIKKAGKICFFPAFKFDIKNDSGGYFLYSPPILLKGIILN